MFVDQATITVKAGDGGRGCNSFYRDKYTRYGIPDGGDGGKGADIIIRADRNLRTLIDFRYNKHFIGRHGIHGSGKNKTGKDALNIVIRVPLGTVVRDVATNSTLCDLNTDSQQVVVVRGGKGGLGNKSHGREATPGDPGEQKKLILDLKLIADVGIVGFPNAGKSTLISNITGAKPEIAAYPFTTKAPVLGVVQTDDAPFVIADIPGLIEGSSQGRGLGDRFLRHIERTKVLLHLVDMSGVEGRDPLDDFRAINKELDSYSEDVSGKPQVIAANKMDLEQAKENLARFKKAVKKKVYPISALNKQGLEALIEGIKQKL